MHPQYTPAFIARFWSKVDKNGPIPPHRPELGPCWLWTGSKARGGYGKISCGPAMTRRMLQTHRVAYELENAPIPDGYFCCHHCDTPGCVRPSHLFAGTNADNVRDCKAKGRIGKGGACVPIERRAYGAKNGMNTHPERRSCGENHYLSKVSNADRDEIRRLALSKTMTIKALAARYGVHPSTAYYIVHPERKTRRVARREALRQCDSSPSERP